MVALASLPILGTGVRALGIGVRALGSAVDLGRPVVPLLALAHGPTVVALLAVWSVGCIRYRSETGVTRTDSAGRS